MSPTNFCPSCGTKLNPNTNFCPKCGSKISIHAQPVETVDRSRNYHTVHQKKLGSTALFLCMCFGMLGAHRFYVGRYFTGLLMLLTGGLLGVWVIIDLSSIARNKFEDKNGNPLELIHNITPVKEIMIIIASVTLWVAILFTAIGLFFNYSTSGLVTVVDNQLSALRNGQIEQAYSYTTQSYQNNNTVDSFKNFITNYPVLVNNVTYSFPQRKIIGNRGFITGYLVAKDNIKTPVVYQLVKEYGQWKIINIRVAIPSDQH